MRSHYWDLMVDTYTESMYGKKCYDLNSKIDASIEVVSVIMSSYGIISMVATHAPAWLLAIVLALAQILSVFRPKMQFSKRKTACNYIEWESNDLFRKMEDSWNKYYDNCLNESDLGYRLDEFKVRFDKIEERSREYAYLPFKKKQYDKSVDEMNSYFDVYLNFQESESRCKNERSQQPKSTSKRA